MRRPIVGAVCVVGLAAACSSPPAADLTTGPVTTDTVAPEPATVPSTLPGATSEGGAEHAAASETGQGLILETAAVDEPIPVDPERGYVLACIRSFEQGDDGYATDTGNGFSGSFQFSPGTWAYAAMGAGYPEWADSPASEAPPEVQDAAAWWLWQQEGYAPWPTPAEQCR